MPSRNLDQVPSSARVSRGGDLEWDKWVGKTVTCPCGFDYVVGSQDERDHFVQGGNRNTQVRSNVGECPVEWGLDTAIERIKSRKWGYVFLPGETEAIATNVWEKVVHDA